MKRQLLCVAVLANILPTLLAITPLRAEEQAANADAPKPSDSEDSPSAETGDSVDALSSKATDPTASLMAFNFKGLWSNFHGPDVPGQQDDRWEFQFQPVIPFEALGRPNIFRATIPYQLGGRGDEGFEPISLFDLLVFNQKWGRWGLGPLMTIDTTGEAPDEVALGPAIGGVWRVNKKLNLGVFNQNVFWDDTAVSQLQPVIAYQLGQGWSLSAGDLQFVYDWKRDRWVNVPVGFQLGKVIKLGKLPVRLSVNPQYNLIDDAGLPKWIVAFTFTALFPSF